MQEWKRYAHILAVLALTVLALSALWILWPVLAALLVGLGFYVVIMIVLRVFHVRIDCGPAPRQPDELK